MGRKVIRSSEIGEYNYCSKSWFYRRQNTPIPKEAQKVMEISFKNGEISHDNHYKKLVDIETKKSHVEDYLFYTILLLVLYLLWRILL